MTTRSSTLTTPLAVVVTVFSLCASALACPFCEGVSMTLAEQVASADSAVLVKWLSGKPAKETDAGTTDFEVVDILRQHAAGDLKKDSKLSLIRYRAAKVGDLFLLIGTVGVGTVEWGSPIDVTPATYDYMKNAPKTDEPPAKRLLYFLKYLEHADSAIGDDAFGEFANAAYADVVALRKELPREKLRLWVVDKKTSAGRIGLYGMMLGLCGNDDDAKLLERKILEPTEEIRFGIDGVMGGYLLLTGETGLAVIEARKLADTKGPPSELYAAMQAVRFMHQYGDNKIGRDRLLASTRIMLDRPEVTDMAIADLARMKDWSVQDRLMELYDNDDFNFPSVKRAIVRFTMAAIKDLPKNEDGAASLTSTPSEQLPRHVVKAQKCLVELEKRDPRIVREARRFYQVK